MALAELFKGTEQKNAFAACELLCRLGGIIAPLLGTLPASASCPVFAVMCVAAACATMTLRDAVHVRDYEP